MHLRCKKGAYEYIDNSDLCVHDPYPWKGRWNELFGDDNPIHLELGSGKGSFITRCAVLHPEINYVAVELYASPMHRAITKAEETGCKNLRFLRLTAEFLPKIFDEGEISRIYLNFSDPWPKKGDWNKRFTSAHYLGLYRNFLRRDGRVEFKTDNVPFFDVSLRTADENGWDASEVTYDLHRDGNPEWNVMSDFETVFVSKGVPICRAVFTMRDEKE